uniref:Uncharacterized protein n=1 Tax=Solanum tuberosum TaxID=4113 RepID=M1DBA7_SOLTU
MTQHGAFELQGETGPMFLVNGQRVKHYFGEDSDSDQEVEMAPKAKNMAGSKRSRKGEASGSSSSKEQVQKFGKKAVERYGWEWFDCQREAKYMGDEFVNEDELEVLDCSFFAEFCSTLDRTDVMARMFGMAELQLRIGGRPVTDAEMETMAEHYPLTESATFLCRTSPAFFEPLDDDEATADEAMDDDEEDDAVDEEANALMVFDHDDGEA